MIAAFKNLVYVGIYAIVFLLVIELFGLDTPTINDSVALGLILSGLLYLVAVSAFGAIAAIVLVLPVAILYKVKDNLSAAILLILAVIVWFVVVIVGNIWILMNGHNYVAWFPEFPFWAAVSFVGISTILIAGGTANSNKKD